MSPQAASAYMHITGESPTTSIGTNRTGIGVQQSPPAGATMTVKGSDGQMHWSDGTNDLGVKR